MRAPVARRTSSLLSQFCLPMFNHKSKADWSATAEEEGVNQKRTPAGGGGGSAAKCGRPHSCPYFDKKTNFSPDLLALIRRLESILMFS